MIVVLGIIDWVIFWCQLGIGGKKLSAMALECEWFMYIQVCREVPVCMYVCTYVCDKEVSTTITHPFCWTIMSFILLGKLCY